MLLVGFFILLDSAFGIWAAKKTKIKLTSRRLSRFITKMFVYQIVIITVYALDVLILGEFFLTLLSIPMVVTKTVALMLIANETFSIDEKIKMVNPQKGIWFYFKRLLNVGKLIKKEVDDLDLMDRDKA